MKSYNDALKILNKSNIKITDELIKSVDSLNRICAENIYSNYNYPSADNSALDGFAINSRDTNDISKKKFKKLKIIGSISAGTKPFKKFLKKNQAIEITTGGILPRGSNSIIPIEKCLLSKDKINNYILIKHKIKKFENVRFKGSDFKKKDLLIKKNTLINSNHIMAFKALGVGSIKVKKKINIIFFSSGNEISENNQISYWKIRNSNHHYIKSLKNNFLFNFKNLGILKDNDGKKFYNKLNDYKNVDILSIVVNFVDILGHSRSESQILKELIPNESAYRLAVHNWFKNSWLKDCLIELANWNADILITSDHGNTIVSKPVKVKADNTASLGIRYKYGRNLNFSDKDVLKIKNPENYGLPSFDVNTEYIISSDNKYFVYENQFHKYSNILKNSFQHGGISLDEVLVPLIHLKNKK